MSGKRNELGELVIPYLRQYSTLPSRRIARIIKKEHPELTQDLESIRHRVRYYRGKAGVRMRSEIATDEFFNQPYDLPMPETYDSSFYEIPYKCGLLLADPHLPYQDNIAIKAAIDWGLKHQKKNPIEFILLGGDVIDCYQLSSFIRDPRNRSIAEEVKDTRDFLDMLKEVFDVPIIYKEANHERRFDNYLFTHAKELVGLEGGTLESELEFGKYNCTYVKDKRVIKFGKLHIIHGDEFTRGIISPVNPARTFFQKAKDCTIGAHFHQTSEHSERRIGRELVTCWSVGCLCQLNAKYAPINNWNHGFALLKRDDERFHITNLRIENGVVY